MCACTNMVLVVLSQQCTRVPIPFVGSRHMTAESAQPRKASNVTRPFPIFVGGVWERDYNNTAVYTLLTIAPRDVM